MSTTISPEMQDMLLHIVIALEPRTAFLFAVAVVLFTPSTAFILDSRTPEPAPVTFGTTSRVGGCAS